jgi:hypothetical protein
MYFAVMLYCNYLVRKGAMMLKRIVEGPEKPDLFVSDEEWDNFAGE